MRLPLLASALVFSVASCDASIGGDANRGEMLHSLALSTARSLDDAEVRAELRAAFSRPGVAEGKIKLSEVTHGASLVGSASLNKFRASLLAQEQDLVGLVAAFPEDVDIYIPAEAQRGSFNEDSEVIAVAVTEDRLLNEDDDSDLDAYDTKGNRLSISAKAPPQEIAVVVAPSETSGPGEGLVESPIDFVFEAPAPSEDELLRDAASACTGRAHEDGDAQIMQDIMVRNVHEPWFLGSPEIYLLMAFPQGMQARFGFDGGNIDVNTANQLYPVGLPLYRWDRNLFAQDILFRFIEADGGWKMDINVKATVPLPYGVGMADVNFVTTLQNMDDDLGIQFVRFDDPCGALYSTGTVDWRLYYSPE